MRKTLVFFSFLVLSISAFGAYPGAIPLGPQGRPATDLVIDGVLKTPDELVQLRQKGLDLSTLNPSESSDLWKNNLSAPLHPQLDQLDINSNADLQYLSNLSSRSGVFRFSVKQEDSEGRTHLFTVLVSKWNYNYLLRKAMLRKLGYQVPAIQYAPSLKVRFKGNFSRNTFITDLKKLTTADAERWVTNLADEDSEEVHLQDVLVFASNETSYNLATGFLPNDIIRGRRLLNALSVVYGLTEIPGTINGFSWKAGQVMDNNYYFEFDGMDEFATPVEDAQWMLKRLAALKRQDFVDIVRETHLPATVQLLLVEKLLARTNSALDAFNLKVPRFNFTPEITALPDLENGILKRTSWPGYGSLFSSPNQPVTPLSDSEIAAFFKSKLNASALASLMNIFDSRVLKGTDAEKRVIDEQIRAAQRQLQHFLETGEVKKIPFGLFAFPTFDAEIYASRDIVIGQYMGTDNLIQLADTFEMSGSAGIFVSAVGLPSDIAGIFQKGVNLTKTYTHLKPTQSIQAAIKEPFRNLYVQRVLKRQAGLFDEILAHDFSTLPSEQQQERVTAVLKEFNQNLKEGESFIVSRSLSGSNLLGVTIPLSSAVQLQPNFYSNRVVLNRLHILKVNDSTLHVYKDDGSSKLASLGIALKAYIPILSLRMSKSTGQASTEFYKIDLNSDLKANPSLTGSLAAIKQVLQDSSVELLRSQVKPYQINHNFVQKAQDSSFLFFRNVAIETTDEMRVSDQDQNSRLFYTSSLGHRKGRDYQGFAIDVVNSILENEVDKNLIISNIGSGDPGDTFKGHSFLRHATFEVENKNGQPTQPFMMVRYNWKGWKASDKKMRSLIEDVNQKFGRDLFSRLSLYGTSEFQLYSIEVNMYLYQETLNTLLKLDSKTLTQVLTDHGTFPQSVRTSGESYQTWKEKNDQRKKRSIANIIKNQREALVEFQKGNFKSGSEKAIEYIATIEGLLPFEVFLDLVGGEQGLLVQGRLFGFRDQQENGDVAIVADTIGRVGSDKPRGGLYQVQQFLGIANSEFMGLWIMRNF